MTYVFLMGGGVAALSAYLPLFGHDAFGLGEAPAGALVAVLGATGIVARIAWADRSQGGDTLTTRNLLILASGATAFGMVLWQAERLGLWALWLGVLGLGATAVAQQSVAMLAVLGLQDGKAGHNTAMVSMAFFAGFIASPIAFGLLVERSGSYDLAWLVVVAQFALATMVATRLTPRRHTVSTGRRR
jgi:nitrate/nitrite transporter NarK